MDTLKLSVKVTDPKTKKETYTTFPISDCTIIGSIKNECSVKADKHSKSATVTVEIESGNAGLDKWIESAISDITIAKQAELRRNATKSENPIPIIAGSVYTVDVSKLGKKANVNAFDKAAKMLEKLSDSDKAKLRDLLGE